MTTPILTRDPIDGGWTCDICRLEINGRHDSLTHFKAAHNIPLEAVHEDPATGDMTVRVKE